MSLWYTPSSRGTGTGKPRHLKRLGTQRAGDQKYRDCSIRLLAFTTGSSVKRESYQAAITDAGGRSLAYLRGFATPEQATQAAHDWIDRHLAKLIAQTLPEHLGRIPKLPRENPAT